MRQRPYWYILDGKTPVPVEDISVWGSRLEVQDRRVAFTEYDGVKVSTVFLGLDHQYGDGPPILFETMIFGGKYNHYQDRYPTWDEAEAGHEQACSLVKGLEIMNRNLAYTFLLWMAGFLLHIQDHLVAGLICLAVLFCCMSQFLWLKRKEKAHWG